jgi:hypothetical protein
MHIDVNIIAFERIGIGSKRLKESITHTKDCL